MEELQKLVDAVKEESEKAGLFLIAQKTKVMKIQKTPEQEDTHIVINGENVENVKIFTLGAVFTDNYDDSVKIKRRLAIAKHLSQNEEKTV